MLYYGKENFNKVLSKPTIINYILYLCKCLYTYIDIAIYYTNLVIGSLIVTSNFTAFWSGTLGLSLPACIHDVLHILEECIELF